MGDSSGGREGRDREWERERILMSDGKESHSVYSSAPLSPMRSEEFDYQQSNITLLKAQLKLVTHERDNLKKDVKRISQERDGAYRHLSLSASPQSSLETPASHHRTNSDTAPTVAKSGPCTTLSRSHSIASAGDKSLALPGERSRSDVDKNPDRLLHELHIARKQHSDGVKKVDQAIKDVEYYRQEAENLRSRYNDVVLEKQRLDQEVASLRRFLEEDRKEMIEMRRQHQEILNVEGGPNESMSIMYGTLLRKYEAIKDDFGLVSKRYDDLVASHSAAMAKLEHCQEEIVRYKKQYEEMLTERNKFKQQCTQAIRQWDQALREKNDYRDALAKVQRQHEEAVKEINQAMAVRIKASKDIKRLTEERNAAMQEYSMIMSERDSVHKEIEKLQDDVSNTNSKMKEVESKSKIHDEEKRKLICQIELLRREIDAALLDRDRTIKEAHELREKLGEHEKTGSNEGEGGNDTSRQSRLDVDPRKERSSASSEHLAALMAAKDGLDRTKVENLEQAVAEIERLRKEGEKLQGELADARLEEDVAKGRRDWAYSERDKVVKERESIRTLCDKLRRERDRAVSELAEALRDLDEVKKNGNEVNKENKDLRERIECVEKDARIRMLQRSVGQSHSRDSAIDTDLQDWETETLDIDMGRMSNDDDLGVDLAGGRDDPACPGENPIYIASISKGSVVEGKLKVNDCILRVNNIDCRDVDRSTVVSSLRGAGSCVSLVVRRRRAGRRYQAVLHLTEERGRQDHGLTLDSGIYVSRISPGSVSARESVIAVGDRVLEINGANMDHVRSVQDATALLNQAHDVLSITLQKNTASYGPLSSSSSGHCMMEEDKAATSKAPSAGTSPQKDSVAKVGSRELIKKQISRDVQTEKYAGFNSSSSSEKVYNVSKISSRESKSPWGQFTETVKEKLDTVRGRRYSKEQGEREQRPESSEVSRRPESGHYSDSGRRFTSRSREEGTREAPMFDQDKEEALAELDSVLASYHVSTASGSSGGKGSGSSGKKKRKDRDSFKNGGTWPRARGGPIIEHRTGTILHPHKYKERLPLSELLTNVPKYPLDQDDAERPPEPERPPVIFRADDRTRHSRNKYRDHRATTYDLMSYTDRTDQGFHLLGQALSRDSSLGDRLKSLSRDDSEDRKVGYLSALTPSDTSIDDSVKSVNVGKEVLAKYLGKIKPSRLATSDSEHTSPVEQLNHPMTNLQQHHPYKEIREGANTKSEYYHLHPSLHNRSAPSGFSPYFPPHHPHTPASMALHQIMSSPRYSSPPPLLPPTPGGEMGLYPPLEPPQSLNSISPTSGLYHSPSPSLEMFGGKSRLLPHHSSHLHHPSASYQPPYGPSSAGNNVFGPGHSGHSHGVSSAMLTHPMGYRLADERELASPPTYPESYRSVRYTQDPPRVTQRRIPSNPSVGSKGSYKISTDSIGRNSDRSSPLPSYHVEVLSPGRPGRLVAFPGENPTYPGETHKPSHGEIRQIHIEKSTEHLGIMIAEGAVGGATNTGSAGGVFVSSVSTNSLASQAGLQVGDQLLEVCGINLRMANYDQAAQVLHRVGNSIDIKVQFNPDKFHVDEGSDSGEESESSVEEDDEEEEEEHPPALPCRASPRGSGSPTPRNSPKVSRAALQVEDLQGAASLRPALPPAAHSTLTRQQVQLIQSRMARSPPLMLSPEQKPASFREKKSAVYHEPRLVYPIMKKSSDLGVRLVGGNAVGIFIHSVDIDSPAFIVGLRSADQILEYNGTDLKNATAEQAAYELAKPAESVALLVQFNPDRYTAIKDHPGDSYFVKAMFDRFPDSNDPLLLRFKKDDILYVDNTMYNGVPGHWSAWLVNQEGQKGTWGIVPSKYKVEEELLLKRTHGGEIDSDSSRRSSTSTRRSFFKRRKAGRSSSRDSKELASYSDVHSLLSYSDSGTLHEEPSINSYVRVEKWDFMMTRPLLIVGPLADTVVDKLVSEHPNGMVRCQPEYVDSDMKALEKGVMDNVFVDFKRRGSHYECTTVSSIREICDRNQHCILDVHLGSVERLHQNQIYPIVLLIKFKSVKQIKEVTDPRYHAEKMTHKDAKNIFEHTQKLEAEYKHLISDVIQGGANLILLCDQIANKIEQEQNKTLWVPAGSIW